MYISQGFCGRVMMSVRLTHTPQPERYQQANKQAQRIPRQAVLSLQALAGVLLPRADQPVATSGELLAGPQP